MDAFVRGLGKVELHAHLHGCVRVETLLELAGRLDCRQGAVDAANAIGEIQARRDRSLDDCFALFDMIHRVVRDKASLAYLTEKVIEDFYNDNVVYLELRSTPKVLADASVAGYVETVIDVIDRWRDRITVRYLLSINRAHSVEQAAQSLEILPLLSPARRKYLAGVDLSGHPGKNRFSDFQRLLRQARQQGLGITVHCGEVDDPDDVYSILAFQPDRLGHALFLPDDVDLSCSGKRGQALPVECCPSSNSMTLQLGSLKQHPQLEKWLHAKHPIALCTDDSGIFQTTLSKELSLVAATFNLDRNQVAAMNRQTIDFAFIPESDKQALKRKIDQSMKITLARI